MTESEILDGKLWEIVKDREAWDAAVHRVTKNMTATEQQHPSLIRHAMSPCYFT